MRLEWSAKETSVRTRGAAKIAALVLIAMDAIIYVTEPFSEIWNDILAKLLLVVAASFAAAVATLVWARYEKTDEPRRIWSWFAVGLWLWVAAELIWGYANFSQGKVSEGIADVFWVAAYLFFGQALLIQYRILVQPSKRGLWGRVVVAILFLFVLYMLLYSLLTSGVDAQSQYSASVNLFYPVADLFLASIALWLARHFRGGAFSRPWLGLLAFSFTDLFFAWLEISGIYSWSVDQANLWSALFDITYLGAYLILGLGLLSQWVFLKYGLRSPTSAH
ncbi:MAG: hypothetical protein EHM40_05005 [Chloroflexi bacterium]|nr:MAG: hypothetical protein EHM40_05005 [Chloroflexota bacterium]